MEAASPSKGERPRSHRRRRSLLTELRSESIKFGRESALTTAADLLKPCLTIHEDSTVAAVLATWEKGSVCAVVDSDNHLAGIVTEHDLARLIYESGRFDSETLVAGHIPEFLGMNVEQLRAVPVTEIMTADPEVVTPDTELDEAMGIIFRSHRKVLLVVEDRRVLGVVHRLDAIKKVLG